jgi:hypothetical protein
MTDRFTQDLPEGVNVGTQVDFLIGLVDHMIKESGWVLDRGGDAIHVITARRVTRFLIAAKERLQTLPRDGDPSVIWPPREMQALLWALGIETPINFDEEGDDATE